MKRQFNGGAWQGALLAAALIAAIPPQAQAAADDAAQLRAQIQALQAQINALQRRLDAAGKAPEAPAPQTQIDALKRRVDAQQAQIEALADATEARPAPASGLHFGGYGEMSYNNLAADDASNDVKQIDLKRFVLFTGYRFSERVRLASELEVEHVKAADGAKGEVEVEQAYLEFDLHPQLTARAGVLLVPVGILNETHEPPTFYGVERNDVETVVLPATWYEGAAALSWQLTPGLRWDVMVHEGLKIPGLGGTAFSVRAGRQSASEADASDLAYTTRLRYTGIPGLEVAGSLQYQSDASQARHDGIDDALLYTAHVAWSHGPFSLHALYAGWQLNGAAVKQADAEHQNGWYVEPRYKPWDFLGLYVRYEDVHGALAQDRFTQWEGGVNYYVIPQVVLKADLRRREHDQNAQSGRDFKGFDLGIGYLF